MTDKETGLRSATCEARSGEEVRTSKPSNNASATKAQARRRRGGARLRRSPEAQDHAALAEHLRLRAKLGVVWWHTPNGGRRDAKTGAQMKRLGTKPGVADLLFFREGQCDCGARRLEGFALELKRSGGRLSEAQLEFLARFAAAGGHTAVAEGIDRAIAVLESWNLLQGRAS